MNIRDLEYLVAVDELKSFIKAARQCFISQPALSQQVKKVEEQLDILIFERDKKSVITTAKGTEVIALDKEILNSYQKFKALNSNEKELKIGLIPTICPYLLPYIVEELNLEFPDVKFYFLELKTSDLIHKLKEGQIDIGIIAHFDNLIDDKIVYHNSYFEEFLLVTGKNCDVSEEDFPEIIASKKLILLEEGNCLSDNVKDICSVYDRSSFNDFYATNIETVKNMIRTNNGAALLPKLSCLDDTNLKLVTFKEKRFREVGLITRKSYGEDKLIKKLNEIIRNSTAKLLQSNRN